MSHHAIGGSGTILDFELATRFGAQVEAQTETFLADYRDEHTGDDPSQVIDAYCDGFREAMTLSSAVIVEYLTSRGKR